MSANPVGWFEIYVQDIARAKAFYETVLETTLTKLEGGMLEMWLFPMAMGQPGAAGALAHVDGMPSGGNSTLVYFNCEDCAQEASRVEAAGGKIKTAKMSIGENGFVAHALDTEGNMFGLHSMK